VDIHRTTVSSYTDHGIHRRSAILVTFPSVTKSGVFAESEHAARFLLSTAQHSRWNCAHGMMSRGSAGDLLRRPWRKQAISKRAKSRCSRCSPPRALSPFSSLSQLKITSWVPKVPTRSILPTTLARRRKPGHNSHEDLTVSFAHVSKQASRKRRTEPPDPFGARLWKEYIIRSCFTWKERREIDRSSAS
jgi:hypothetical protein